MSAEKSNSGKTLHSDLPLNRIEAFSDGVIAIIITILVLEFKVPHLHGNPDISQGLKTALVAELPKFASYLISFLVLTVWWIAHHQLIHLLRRADRKVLWLNALFLMFLSLIPFPTGLIGEYPDQPLAAVAYGAVCFFTGLSFLGLRWYISRNIPIVKSGIPESILKRDLRRGSLSPILYAIATGTAAFWPLVAICLFALIPVYYLFPSPFFGRSQTE